MTPDERALIDGLFQRLAAADQPDKDRDADEFIRQSVAKQPASPYLMVQTILVQEHALTNAQGRIAELEKQLADAKQQADKPKTSFLGGLLGGGAPAQSAPSSGGQSSAGPWGGRPAGAPPPAGWTAPAGGPPPAYAAQAYQQQQPYGQQQYPTTSMMGPQAGGGFLRSALTTAAGVAGGALLFQGISSMLSHNSGAFGPGLASSNLANPGVTENITTVNNYYSDPQAAPDYQNASYQQPVENASDWAQPDPGYQEASYDDGGFDSGGGDDYA